MTSQQKPFTVICECGETNPVAEWDAGKSWECRCGRTVSVPSLSELRKSIGLSAVPRNPAEIVRSKVKDGTLPPATCLTCHGVGNEVVPLIAICETATKVQREDGDQFNQQLLALLIFPMWFASLFVYVLNRLLNRSTNTTFLGRNVSVEVPVRLCNKCRRLLPSPVTLKAFSIFKYFSLIAAIVVLFLSDWRYLFIPFLLASLVFLLFEWLAAALHFSRYRRFLSTVPEYHSLFQQYSSARVGEFSKEELKEEW